jgi:hypothetical protein
MLMLAAFIAVVVLVPVLTIAALRFVVRWCGIKELVEDGAVLTDSGVEYLRNFMLGRGKIKFSEIESVKLVSCPIAVFWLMFPIRYGFSVQHKGSRLFSDFVEIKVKRSPRWYEYHFNYLLFTPKDGAAWVERFKNRAGGLPPKIRALPNLEGG